MRRARRRGALAHRRPAAGRAVTIHDQITATGAPALLLEHYAGRLEYHDPWHAGREVSHLFRGLVDAFEATTLLAERGITGLRLVDNGAVHRRSPALEACRRCAPTTWSPRRRRRPAAWRSTCARAGWSPRTRSRSATRARTSAARRRSARSGSSPTRSRRTPRSARRWRIRQRARGRGLPRRRRLRGGRHDAGRAPARLTPGVTLGLRRAFVRDVGHGGGQRGLTS